jgi:hypothetical protein
MASSPTRCGRYRGGWRSADSQRVKTIRYQPLPRGVPETGIGQLALWAGTSEATIKRHYREVLTSEAGETWFKTGVSFTAAKFYPLAQIKPVIGSVQNQ